MAIGAVEVHKHLNIHKMCAEHSDMGAELPDVQSEFAKLKTEYLEYQTQQRFYEMLRNEDVDISRDGDDEKAYAESREKLLMVQEKSAELASKIRGLVNKFGDVSKRLERNKVALKSIENVERKVQDIENQKMDIDEDDMGDISTKCSEEEMDVMKKAEMMKANAENQSKATQVVQSKNAELRSTVRFIQLFTIVFTFFVVRMNTMYTHTQVNSLEEQVLKMRRLFQQGKADLETQRERRKEIEILEKQSLEALSTSELNAKQAQAQLVEIQAKCAETSKKTSQESKKYEAKRKHAETHMDLLQNAHGFKVLSAKEGVAGHLEICVQIGSGVRIVSLVSRRSGRISKVVRVEVPDLSQDSEFGIVQGRCFSASDLCEIAQQNGFSVQWLAQQIAERWTRHTEFMQETRSVQRLHDLTVKRGGETDTIMHFTFPFAVADGLQITIDVPLDYPSPQATPSVISLVAGPSFKDVAAVSNMMEKLRRDRLRSLSSILEAVSRVSK